MYLKLIGLTTGEPHEFAGQYVISYDPSFHQADGTYDGGKLVCTPRVEEAGAFTFEEALALWKAAPVCPRHRRRADLLPNRPLSAFDVEIGHPGGEVMIQGVGGR
jgi:hypothetical protein